jgi:hypothetical protein
MKNVFKNSGLGERFKKDGFVVLPLLNDAEVKELIALYKSLETEHAVVTNPVHSTTDTNNPELMTEVDIQIKRIMKRAVEANFDNFQYFLGTYLVKEPGDKSVITPHQDWTFVDEDKYFSASLWCPLVDVDVNNGCLYVLKGSHRQVATLRPSPDYPSVYDNVRDILDGYMEAIPMKAGEVMVYDHALVHASPPNRTQQTRLAVVLGLLPAEAEMYHFYHHTEINGKRRVEKFLMDNEQFIRYRKHTVPAAKSLGDVTFDFTRQLTHDSFKGFYERNPLKRIIRRIKSLA